VAGIVAAVFASDPRVHVHRLPRNTHFATASNVAFAFSTGEFAVFLNNDTEARAGWLRPLLEPLADPAVVGTQPLMLYPDDSIQTAGTVFYGRQLIPGHLLASHPPEDCPPDTSLALRAVTAACAAFRAESVAGVRGFDPVFVNGMEDVDLCLRLADPSVPAFRLAAASHVAHHESKSPGRFARSESNRLRFLARWGGHLPGPEAEVWRQVGFELVGMPVQKPLPRSGRRTAITPMLVRSPVRSATDPVTGIPCLRWALKISSPGGPEGDDAPETKAARGLASLLTDLGQDVVVDRAGAHERPSSDYLDDVVVAFGDTHDARPIPGSVNIMWSADPQEIDPRLWDHVMSGPVHPTATAAQTLLRTALGLQSSKAPCNDVLAPRDEPSCSPADDGGGPIGA
ncbi:MAG: glycosyltransferase, partial [Acidimicrobiales bacterium]|nr:glycosyltransferase [Acidimicrobiales bacterium]